jgi:hypothetical protein
MIVATGSSSFRTLNKIIINSRGLSPASIHATLHCAACSANGGHNSHKHRLKCRNISASPVYLYCNLKCRLVPRIATSTTSTTPIPEFSFFIPSFYRLFPLIFLLNFYTFITLKISSSTSTRIHPHLELSSSQFEILALLRSYAAEIGSLLPTFRDNISVPGSRTKQAFFLDFSTLENGTDNFFFQNVG